MQIPSWTGQCFIFTGMVLTLNMNFPSLYIMLLSNLVSAGSKNDLSIIMIPYSIASDQGTHFTTKEMQQQGLFHVIDWSYHVEADVFIEH
jgi:hypothetical protein